MLLERPVAAGGGEAPEGPVVGAVLYLLRHRDPNHGVVLPGYLKHTAWSANEPLDKALDVLLVVADWVDDLSLVDGVITVGVVSRHSLVEIDAKARLPHIILVIVVACSQLDVPNDAGCEIELHASIVVWPVVRAGGGQDGRHYKVHARAVLLRGLHVEQVRFRDDHVGLSLPTLSLALRDGGVGCLHNLAPLKAMNSLLHWLRLLGLCTVKRAKRILEWSKNTSLCSHHLFGVLLCLLRVLACLLIDRLSVLLGLLIFKCSFKEVVGHGVSPSINHPIAPFQLLCNVSRFLIHLSVKIRQRLGGFHRCRQIAADLVGVPVAILHGHGHVLAKIHGDLVCHLLRGIKLIH
mmetsp:Transcript_24920/g.64689  ORF Transcript_24920/g.64689 Transcript_24920/m.64689 type:complete len:350 (+) Transcript_24920:940-1989(+)